MASLPAPPSTTALLGAFEEIDRRVLGASAASLVLSGIDPAFKLFRLSAAVNGSAVSLNLRYNNDAGANYSLERLIFSSTTVTPSLVSASTSHSIAGIAIAATVQILLGKEVAGTRAQMVGQVGIGGTTTVQAIMFGGYWDNVSALINRIDIIHTTLEAGTVVVLEGNRTA